MAGKIETKLEGFKDIDGFLGVGAITPQGEVVAQLTNGSTKIGEIGAIANDVLLKAQKATDIMQVGRGNLLHIQAPKANILVRCLNESTDFSATTKGRAHVHMVLVLESDGNLALGKIRLEQAIQEVAEDFR